MLVVEDEDVLADAIARGLRQVAMAVDVSHDGASALERIAINHYDVVVLDRDLPVVHGDEVCRRLAVENLAPRILMLTASADVDDRVEGLTLGADDYLAKPFAFTELVARIRALARRAATAQPAVIERGGVTLDSARRVASRDGRFLRLTNNELAVLQVLLGAEGAVVSAEELLERAWDEHADPFTNAVRVMMVKLRRKLGNPPVIETVAGAGYRIP